MLNKFATCVTSEEVFQATEQLSKAKLVDLKFDDGGVLKNIDNMQGVYNYTEGRFCAAVAPNYHVIQHKDYFDHFAKALERLNISFKMTIRESFNRAYADIEFVGRNLKFDTLNEEFTTGIRLENSYDKTRGLLVMPRYTRLACTNGMIVSRTERTLSIRHHSKMAGEIEVFVEKRLHEIINGSQDLQEWVSQGMGDTKEWLYCCKILEKLVPSIRHREHILKDMGVGVVVKREKGKKPVIEYVLNNPEGKKMFTRWELYNFITQHITHGQQISPLTEAIMQKKAEVLLYTPMERLVTITL